MVLKSNLECARRWVIMKLVDTPGGLDHRGCEKRLEAKIERVWRGISSPCRCKLGGHDRVNLEMSLEGTLVRT